MSYWKPLSDAHRTPCITYYFSQLSLICKEITLVKVALALIQTRNPSSENNDRVLRVRSSGYPMALWGCFPIIIHEILCRTPDFVLTDLKTIDVYNVV